MREVSSGVLSDVHDVVEWIFFAYPMYSYNVGIPTMWMPELTSWFINSYRYICYQQIASLDTRALSKGTHHKSQKSSEKSMVICWLKREFCCFTPPNRLVRRLNSRRCVASTSSCGSCSTCRKTRCRLRCRLLLVAD